MAEPEVAPTPAPTKPWWQSRTIWAGVFIVILAGWNGARESLAPGLPEVPEWLLTLLAGLGLYTARTSKTVVAAMIVAFGLTFASQAAAQETIPLTSVAERAHVTANAGAMVLTNGDDWSGASLGGILTYNLHPQFSLSGGYDHGIPVNDVDQSLDLWRVFGSVRIHPNALVGFGYAWFSEGVDGGLVQLTVGKKIAPRVALQAMYAHVFADAQLDDFEYARVFVNYHLLGRD